MTTEPLDLAALRALAEGAIKYMTPRVIEVEAQAILALLERCEKAEARVAERGEK